MRAYDFEIPKSVADYLANGRENKLKPVVDSLLGNLSGSAPVTTREELLAYNQGILLAVQVRADMVKMLLDLFEICVASQVAASKCDLSEKFDANDHEIQSVWSEPSISSSFFRRDDRKSIGEYIIVDLEISSDRELIFCGAVVYKDDNQELPTQIIDTLEQFHYDEDDQFLKFKVCSWADFVSDAQTQIERTRAAVHQFFTTVEPYLNLR